jgi:hypothetical protein
MKPHHRLAAIAALALASLAAQAAPVVIDVGGAQSINLLGEAGNTVWLVDIGANAVLTSLDWNVALTAFAPSALAEMQVSFGSATGTDLLTLSPGSADPFGGSGSYVGSMDLTGLSLAVGADGLLRIEFSEGFKDFALDMAEGQWVSGNLTFGISAVPEPAGVALLLAGLGLVAVRARRA